MVQTDVDVALSIELYIWKANLSLYTIYVIYVHIYDKILHLYHQHEFVHL